MEMRVALINPPHSSRVEKHWSGYASLGLGYLAAPLLEKGFDVSVIDGKLTNLSLDGMVERALSFRPYLVGITSMTIDFQMTKKISYRLKQQSNIPIIL